MVERRTLVSALGVCAIAVSSAVRAQQPAKPARVAVLFGASPETSGFLLDAFMQQMRELGHVESRDVVYDVRFARGKIESMPALAQELVALHPDIILTTITPGAIAARQATRSIPIVATTVTDPVGSGLTKSLARPDQNFTGFVNLSGDLSPKRLEFLLSIVPKLARIAVVKHPAEPVSLLLVKHVQAAAQRFGVEVVVLDAATPTEVDGALGRATREHIGAVLFTGLSFSILYRHEVADSALRHRMPTIFDSREPVEAGGLMSYGIDLPDVFRRGAVYVDKILKGAKPGDLPIEQAARLELVINRKTAKALGLTIPQSLLLRADKVIE